MTKSSCNSSGSSSVLTENDVKMFASATGVRQSKLRAITSICVKGSTSAVDNKNSGSSSRNKQNGDNTNDIISSTITTNGKSPTNNLRISTKRRKRSRTVVDSPSSSSSSSSSLSDDGMSETSSPNSSSDNSVSPKIYKQKLSSSLPRIRKPILSESREREQHQQQHKDVRKSTNTSKKKDGSDSEESTERASTTRKRRRRRTSVTSNTATSPASSPADTSTPDNRVVCDTVSKFEYITKNIYIGGKRALSDYDAEEHVCNCTIPHGKIPKGYVFCGNGCVNRMLNIECDKHLCPCGTRCSNQRFQRREWANVEIRDSGPKGRGLFTKEKLTKGQFVFEYVGEVCDEESYQARMQEYDGERHFYFLSLDSQHVIDASRKGNKARYINHSCNPNCELQKWLVGCETRVGIFAVKDVAANSELTFDYAMEVYGLKRQKCYCGEANCRGSIKSKEKEEKVLTAKQLERMETVKRRNKMRQVTKYTLKNQDDYKITDLIEEAAYENHLFLVRNLRRGIRQRIIDLIQAQRCYEAESEESENDVDEFGLTARERRRQLERYEALQKMHLPAVRTTRGSTKSRIQSNSKPAVDISARKTRQKQSRKRKVRDDSTSTDESSSEEEKPRKKVVHPRRRKQKQSRSKVESESEDTSEESAETSESESEEEKPKQKGTLRKPRVEKKKIETSKVARPDTFKKKAQRVKSDGLSDEFEFKADELSDFSTSSRQQNKKLTSTQAKISSKATKTASPRKKLAEATVNKRDAPPAVTPTKMPQIKNEQTKPKQPLSRTAPTRLPSMVKKVLSSGNGIFALLDRKPTPAKTAQPPQQKLIQKKASHPEAKPDNKKRSLEKENSPSRVAKKRRVIDNEE